MPTLPWTALADMEHGDEYVVVATRFVLTSRIHLGRIFSAAQALISTLTSTPGLLGYSLRARLAGNSLWTLSAWRTDADMRQFVRGAAHATVVKGTARWMRTSQCVSWDETAHTIPPSWVTARSLMRTRGAAATHPRA